MEFRKYGGYIKDVLNGLFFVFLMGLLIMICAFAGDFEVFCSVFSIFCLAFTVMAALCISLSLSVIKQDKETLSDRIEIDGEGIKLKPQRSPERVILWEDVAKIERLLMYRQCPRIYVTSLNGEGIWWYRADKRAESYILEQHPELRQSYNKKKVSIDRFYDGRKFP